MTFLKTLKSVISEYGRDHAARLAAALAFYTIFSIAPLLIISIAIVAFVYGADAASGEVVGRIEGVVGEAAAVTIQRMIVAAARPRSSIVATALGTAVMLWGASNVFNHLRFSLNYVWNVQPSPALGMTRKIVRRVFAVLLVLPTGILLLVSFVASALLSGIIAYFQDLLPGLPLAWQVANFLISFGITVLLFALLFKFIADVKIAWEPVWVGALVTALLFSLGRLAIGLYLGWSAPSSSYGAAGSVIVILLWLYYSAQILLFGAEFTQAYSRFRNKPIVPATHAIFRDRNLLP